MTDRHRFPPMQSLNVNASVFGIGLQCTFLLVRTSILTQDKYEYELEVRVEYSSGDRIQTTSQFVFIQMNIVVRINLKQNTIFHTKLEIVITKY